MSQAGEYIDAFCTKCELLLDHVILFEVKGVVSRVKCRTCGHEHKYRGVKPAPKKNTAIDKPRIPRTSKKMTAAQSANLIETQRWQEKRLQPVVQSSIRDYRMPDKYSKNEIINHEKFGLGYIEKIVSDTRMDVLFQDGLKLMAMNTNYLI